ncbi:MAG: glutamate 5-kinase [Verrucomicrobiota bacterium]
MKSRKKILIVKLGSGLLAASRGGINRSLIGDFAEQIAQLHKRKYQVILVSSGAVSSGMMALNIEKRPKDMHELQVCATIGQPRLMQAYQEAFSKFNICTGQILLTRWDLDSRKMYENTQVTVQKLLALGNCVPIFNENDAITFDELTFGDNDTLSAHIAILAKASLLVILTSVDGLKSCADGAGKLIRQVKKITPKIESFAGHTHSERSVGGMISKIQAARTVTQEGIPMVIANGKIPNVLLKIARGKSVGTLFTAHSR